MRSINELISFIKRISPDEVIQPSELLYLKDWTDRNRNLACDSTQEEIIVLLDRLIKHETIEKNNKEMIISMASSLVKGNTPGIDLLFDLYGIMDQIGHNQSGRIEETDILIKWREQKQELFLYDRSDERLDEIIDNVIDQNRISEEDRNYALKLIDGWTQSELFEARINHLRKLVRRRKNIGPELIEVLDDEDAVNYLLDLGGDELECYLDPGIFGYYDVDPVIVVSLTLIAMLNYDNGNYYSHVRETYSKLYWRYSEQRVEGAIRSILSEYRKKGESASRTRIINVVLENALVPQAYLTAYFEFIFDIYKLNFDYDLPENPYEEFRFVFEGLKGTMQLSGDDLAINATHKTYKLIASTKALIADDEGMDALIKLSIMVVKLIDKRFWDKEVKIFNPYLKVGFEGWEKQLISMAPGNREHRQVMHDFVSRWEPKFSFDSSEIYLVPPAHRIKAQYDYKTIAIEVLNDGIILSRRDNCYIKEIIGGYEVRSLRIKVENPLGKLSYRVLAGEEVLYDSKDKLYRDYIVFNKNHEEMQNNTDYQGAAYICYKPGTTAVECLEKYEHYCWGYKLIRGGEALAIGHDVFNFSSMIKPGVFGGLHAKCQVLGLKNGEKLDVYRIVNALVFEVENALGKLEITINGKPYKLAELSHKKTERGSITKYVVDLNIDKSGIYEVEVNLLSEGKSNQILSRRFALDKELDFEVSELEDGKSAIRVNTGFFKDPFITEVSPDVFDPNFISFSYNGFQYAYYLPLNLRYYSINNGKWYSAVEDMWIDDIPINASLKLFDSECNGIHVYGENATLLEYNIAIQDQGTYKMVNVGFLNSYKTNNKFVSLVFMKDYKRLLEIVCYNKCVIDEDLTKIEFKENPPRILVTPSFHGKNKVSFVMKDTQGERWFTSKLLESGQTECIDSLRSFEEYTFDFYEKAKVLRLPKDSLLYTVSRTFYAKRDFVGREFKIDTIYYCRRINKKEMQEIECRLYYVYVRITESRDDGVLIGSIFVKTYKGIRFLNNINPVEIEICSEIIDDSMDAYITNQGDGLLFDERKHRILDSIEDPWAPDIFLYSLNLKGDGSK